VISIERRRKCVNVFALACATSAVSATPGDTADDDDKWEGDFRKCQIQKPVPAGEIWMTITPDELPNMQKWITFLKVCDKFWTCVRKREEERERGKKPRRCNVRDRIPEW
jgi:hypothetical protein